MTSLTYSTISIDTMFFSLKNHNIFYPRHNRDYQLVLNSFHIKKKKGKQTIINSNASQFKTLYKGV